MEGPTLMMMEQAWMALYPVDGGGGEITATKPEFSYFLYENKCCYLISDNN
jgi:hypothetical protein